MPLRPRGTGGPIAAKRKNQNLQKSKFQKLQNPKIEILKNFRCKFVFREIDLEIAWRKIVFLFSRSAEKITSSSSLRFFVSLCSIRNVRGVYLMRANSVPMKRRHSTWLNSHGSEERT
jgi:hypothetical protein